MANIVWKEGELEIIGADGIWVDPPTYNRRYFALVGDGIAQPTELRISKQVFPILKFPHIFLTTLPYQ